MALVFHGRSSESDAPTWITAFAPSPAEVEQLRALGFEAESLAHALDPHERPRVRVLGSGHVFVVLRTPMPTGKSVPYDTTAISFFVERQPGRPGLTIGPVAPPFADALLEATEHECLATRRAHVMLRALELTGAAYLESLSDLIARIERAEDQLQQRLRNEEVLDLVSLQRSLVHIGEALEGIHGMLGPLREVPGVADSKEDQASVEDVFVELRQARAMTRMSREVLSGMMDAFGSVIANNLNAVMKVMASLTIVVTVPMLVSSLYGMNVELPGQRAPHAFVWLLACSLLLATGVAALFRTRRWL